MWRLSGIYRDVYLVARPEVYVEDVAITTDLREEYQDALLKVRTIINSDKPGMKTLKLRTRLLDPEGKEVVSYTSDKTLTVRERNSEAC